MMEKTEQLTLLAQGIEKHFTIGSHRIEVLQGVDLTLRKGETVAIVGVSGTGKTTLLHILGTLDRPSSGILRHGSADVYAMNDTELSAYRNRTIGFVFQFHHLLPEFTAVENIMMPGLIAGLEREQLLHEAHAILARFNLDERGHHKIGELSGGERQRVALARALIMKPALLLADEPTGDLDGKTGDMVFELIREMSDIFSLSTVIVTHNLDHARQLNRCLSLSEGKLHE